MLYIIYRYNALVEGANDRRQQLQDALMLTSEFAELERPLTQWLDQSNKRLSELGKIATDPEKLQEQINKLEVHYSFIFTNTHFRTYKMKSTLNKNHLKD